MPRAGRTRARSLAGVASPVKPEASAPHWPAAAWTERLLDAIPLPPAGLAIATAGLLLMVYTVMELAIGRVGELIAGTHSEDWARETRVAVVNTLVLGYFVGAHRALRSSTRRHLDALRPVLADVPAGGDYAEDFPPDPGAASRGGFIGIAVTLAFPFVIDWGELPFLEPGYWIPERIWHWPVLIAMGWMAGRLGYASLYGGRVLSRLARFDLHLDLLETHRLGPFVQQGTQTALIWVGAVAVAALHLVNEGMATVMAIGMLSALGVSVTSLVLPLRGVHERLVQAKAHDLDWVRRAIREERERLRDDAEVRDTPGRITDLLAYEARIEAVREWPFDTPTFLRVGLYLLIPLASWSAGALVERLIDALLD